tara:strand:- start:1616 stop:1972 length:357 start_codon:yes stop_codon:yes gene_type:complete
MKSKGLGDTIEKITKATGIKKVVDTISEVTGKDCGCDSRKKALNKLWTYKGRLGQDDFEYLEHFFENYNGNRLKDNEQRDRLYVISNTVFNRTDKPTSCSSCLRELVENLRKEYQRYL